VLHILLAYSTSGWNFAQGSQPDLPDKKVLLIYDVKKTFHLEMVSGKWDGTRDKFEVE
jgi:hypothetical protein